MLAALEIFGSLPRINRKLAPAYNRKKKTSYIRTTKEWKTKYAAIKEQIIEQVDTTIETEVDLVIWLSINNHEDSDAPIKGLFDCIEEAGALRDDNLIRHYLVIREEWDGEDHARVEVLDHGSIPVALENWLNIYSEHLVE